MPLLDISIDVLRTFSTALGAALALHLSYRLFATIRLYARPSHLRRYLYADASGRQPWALVTGSSDGIGKYLASELASHGFNIVLHGRNPEKLENVRKELQIATPNIYFRIIIADASQCHRFGAVDFDDIKRRLADLHLTVLINCAGSGPNPSFGPLETYSRDQIASVLYLNAVFPTMMTATLLPLMRGDAPKGNGLTKDKSGGIPQIQSATKRPVLIMNIGSVTDAGFPLVSFYSAGKAAAHALHQAVAREALLDGSGVEIISHRVGAVTGVSHQRAPATLFRPHARTLARAILARTGCGRKSVIPYWPHALQQAMLAATPEWIVDSTIGGALKEEWLIQKEELRRT
ncbi:short chain dehydrogenase/reductase [Xylariaceae sp. FL0255]|nr:short chain dehydrogenase/reductase [Xylariaceae sp. FL0255]